MVPYSLVLSKTFRAHINIEMCNSVESIKYICKYINKGSDQATFTLTNNDRDEVSRFQSERYISSSEAVCSVFRYTKGILQSCILTFTWRANKEYILTPKMLGSVYKTVRERLKNPRQRTLLAFFDYAKRKTSLKH